MSIITLQFGQCGNQVGNSLFSLISEDISQKEKCDSVYYQESLNKWFEPSKKKKHLARAILVDTERKVTDEISDSKTKSDWMFNKENIVSDSGGGSANNWSYGYTVKSTLLHEEIEEKVRKVYERTDNLAFFLSLLSSAGGTGSGVGTKTLEILRDLFPKRTFVTCAILPYASGEVATQNYNTILSLAKIYDISNMTILFQNSYLHSMCSSLLKIKSSKFEDLNELIAIKLSSLYQPTTTKYNDIFDINSKLYAHPSYKFVNIKTTPHISKESKPYETRFHWDTLIKHIKNTLRTNSAKSELFTNDYELRQPTSFSPHQLMNFVPSIATVLVTRGKCEQPLESLHLEFQDKGLYPKWLPTFSQSSHFHNQQKFLDMDKLVTLAVNNSQTIEPIEDIVEKGWTTFSYKAFLHKYKQYNIGEEEFIHSFAKLETIIKAYKEL